MKKRIQLKEQEIQVIRQLKDNGCRVSFVARYASLTYGTHRTTAYRHVTENPDAYKWKEPHSVRNDRELRVCQMLSAGRNTLNIATTMDLPLCDVNRVASRCRMRYPGLFSHERRL
jgi:hypothetical protein